MKKIAILTGGDSAEAEISKKSSEEVKNNLDPNKYNAEIITIKNKKWFINNVEIDKNNIKEYNAVFITIHGPPAENGEIQEFLDKMKIPYTCCESKISYLSFNKHLCKEILKKEGYNCAKSILINEKNKKFTIESFKKIGFPCIVKPNQSGSSFGISLVKNISKINDAINNALKFDSEYLIEEFISGKEVSCGVLTFKNKIISLPITEIISENDFFDYEAKYEGKSNEITPARINNEMNKKIKLLSTSIYKKFNLSGICRIDYIINDQNPFIIEINTIPGLSKESIIPKQIKAAGYRLDEIFENCLENSMNK